MVCGRFSVQATVVICAIVNADQKSVYIACDDHTDYMWTADEEAYRQAFLNMVDYYLNLADQTAYNQSPFQSRFACDGSLWLWEYERNRPEADWLRLIGRLRSGHISSPMTVLVSCYGGTPPEAVLRGMYYAGRLERRYDLRFRLAVAIENQTHPWGLASLWAGSGAKYSWNGICGCASQVPDAGDREHDIYWHAGPDGQRILTKWNSFFGNQSMGGYAECWNVAQTVELVTNSGAFHARYPYPIIGCFGRGWDMLETLTDEFVTAAQVLTTAERQVVVSNEQDFFEAFEAEYGGAIPTEARSYGNEWELYCASMAEVSASVKRTLEKLRTAEALATIVSAVDPTFMTGRETARDLAFMDLGLYWEHDWTGDGPVPREARAAWQRRLAAEIAAYVDALHADAAAALGSYVAVSGPNPRFCVFNPLGWTRSDYADLPWSDPNTVHVIGVADQAEVPSQILVVGGQLTLRILAADVPAVGYRVFEIVPGPGQAFDDAAVVTGAGSTATVTYTVAADDRDAMSLNVGGALHEVRISGYSTGEPDDFVGSDEEAETAAMQFQIDVPPPATIQGAYVTVRAVSSASPSPTGGLQIHLYDVDDAAPFQGGPLGDLINHHPTLPAPVAWPAPAWPGGSAQVTPNLAALVQAYVDRSGYLPGSHIGFVVTEGTIEANRYYGWQDLAAGGAPPQLTVTYATPARGALVLESARYRIEVSERGAITSLIDKTHANRELARSIGGRVLNDLGPSPGTLVVESAGAVSVTLKATAPAPLQHTTRVTLYRDSDRISLANEITQNFGGVYTYGFGFDLTSPQVRHEEVGAIARAALTAAGGDYSPRQARYDWLTLNHFAGITGAEEVGVTLSNADCYFFRLGNSAVSNLDTATPQLSPLAGGQVDGPGLGIHNQGGDSYFLQRFALRAHDGYDPAAAMRFALEHQNPLVGLPATGTTPRLPADSLSGVSVSDPQVLLWALKPAEEGLGAGVIARLWNMAESPTAAALQLAPRPVMAAHRTTHLETNEEPLAVTVAGVTLDFARQQLRTVRLIPGRLGDLNCDGVVDFDDISPFVLALSDPATYASAYPTCSILCGDGDHDGDVDFDDIDPFVALLAR